MRLRKTFVRLYTRLETLCLRSWWVFLFGFLCLTVHERQAIGQREKKRELERRLEALEFEKSKTLLLNEELKLQIASQNDPDYRELILMKVLGVVPEGTRKVCFYD